MERIFNWGIYPTIDAECTTLNAVDKVAAYVRTTNAFIPRGNGRCYGDSALQPKIFSTLALNKFFIVCCSQWNYKNGSRCFTK